jgi:cytochrome b involved in lipid metabolism
MLPRKLLRIVLYLWWWSGALAFSRRFLSSPPRRHHEATTTKSSSRRQIHVHVVCWSSTNRAQQDIGIDHHHHSRKDSRFNTTAPSNAALEQPCTLKIHDKMYDLQAFAKAHPGGSAVLKKFHNKDATKAFELAEHSDKARQLLKMYEIKDPDGNNQQEDTTSTSSYSPTHTMNTTIRQRRPWRKLFTKEDPVGYHKYLGIFCLLHFAWRHGQLFSTSSVTAGFGGGPGASSRSLWFLLPHALLNASAFIFHSVPRERIVGSPMIWEEYRVHNLIFVLRSIVCTALCHFSIVHGHAPGWRKFALYGSLASILGSNYAADVTTKHLQPSQNDSSVASLPFWDGCTLQTQRRIKKFYAFCQFMATIACLMVSNPAWPFVVMMPIQFSSILLTLVRKSILGAKGWHVAYLLSLLFPFLVASQHFLTTRAWDVPIAVLAGSALFCLRCRGTSKYWLWGSAGMIRVLFGDQILRHDIW